MSELTEPKVHIIILNWNGKEDTIECLKSIKGLRYSNYETVVIDNASTDGSVSEIEHTFPGITLLESEINRGYAGGNNIGLRYALDHDADYVWILNNDTIVHENALGSLIEKIEADSSIGICGSRLIYYHDRETIQALGGGTYNKWLGTTAHVGANEPASIHFNEKEIERRLDYIVGASMLVSDQFLKEVGLLSEDYFLYYEELDWSLRAKGTFKLGYADSSLVYHKEGASIKGNNVKLNSKSRLSDYYQIKNRLKFTWKFYPQFLPVVYLTVFYSMLNRIKRKQWKRIPMILNICFTFNK